MVNKFFEEQGEDETVYFTFGKHWLALVHPIIASGILIILGIAGLFLPIYLDIKGDTYKIYLLFESLIFLMAVILFYVPWVLYYLSVGVLTNIRIVDIDQHSLFHRNTTFARLENIEDISIKTIGFLGTFFKVGRIDIMTAGEVPNLEYPYIKHPEKIAEEIHKAQQKAGIAKS